MTFLLKLLGRGGYDEERKRRKAGGIYGKHAEISTRTRDMQGIVTFRESREGASFIEESTPTPGAKRIGGNNRKELGKQGERGKTNAPTIEL